MYQKDDLKIKFNKQNEQYQFFIEKTLIGELKMSDDFENDLKSDDTDLKYYTNK